MTIPPPQALCWRDHTLRLSLGALCTFLTLLKREKKIIYDLLFSYVFFSLSLSRFHSMALKRKTTAVAQVIFNFGRKHPLGYCQFVARRSAELNA